MTDPSNAPVAGAVVRTGALTAATDLQGRFRFLDIPPGQHRLTVQANGFAPAEKNVTITRSVEVHFKLRIADLRHEVTVAAEPEFHSPSPQISLASEEMQRLPAPAGNTVAALADWIGVLPGAGGGLSIVVDGMERPLKDLNPSQIAEVRIGANPFSAEFSRPGSSRIEIRTKSATDAWRASLTATLLDSRFAASNAFAARKPRESLLEFDGSVSGPIGKEASLLLATEIEREREQALVVARTPEGDVRTAVATPSNDIEHRVALQFPRWTVRYEHSDENEQNGGVGGFRLPETAFDRREASREVQVGLQDSLAGWWSDTQARVERETFSAVSRQTEQVRISVDDAFTAGGAQADESGSEWSLRLSQIFSRVASKHQIRFGAQFPGWQWVHLTDRTARQGTWRFASLDDYLRGTPYSFTARRGEEAVEYSIYRWALFVQDEWRIMQHVNLSAGLRYDTSSAMTDRTNLAPRFGIAWRAAKNTVIRAGGGLFFDFIGESTWRDTLRLNGLALREVLVRNPPYPLPVEFVLTAQPPNIVRLDPRLRAPQIWEGSVGVEHGVLTLSWRQSRGYGLFRSVDGNAPVPGVRSRPNLSVGQLRQVQSAGRLNGQWLEAGVRWKPIRIQARWGRLRSDTSGQSFLPANSYDPAAEWGYDDADRRWRIQSVGSFRLAGDVGLGVIFRAQSGAPYTIRTGRDDNFDGVANDRPAGVERNTLRGTAETTIDLRLAREFRRPNEKGSVELIFDAFNVLNRVNYSGFVGNMSSPFFGQPTSARSPRRLQFSIRLRL